MTATKKIRIKLVKSPIARLPTHRLCVKALGLSKVNQVVVCEDTAEIRGIIRKISYMLAVEE